MACLFPLLSCIVKLFQDVEVLGLKYGFTLESENFHNVSLGQGQEVVAERAMDEAAVKGHWVILQVGTLSDPLVSYCYAIIT